MTQVVVTGAGGFIGARLVQRLLRHGLAGQAVSRLCAVDLNLDGLPENDRLQRVAGSVADEALVTAVCSQRPDVVFHLASVPGGAAEKNPLLSREVNLDATVRWLEGLAALGACPRFVYASSIAVYGEQLPRLVHEDMPPRPALTYGAHKLACELLVADATRRGDVQGCALRLPGIVARPGSGEGLISAFMSQLFWCLRDGRALTVPVTSSGTAWWLSADACVENLLHAAGLEGDRLRVNSTFQMPALHLTVQAVVEALGRRFGRERARLVSYEPQELVQRLFASYPPLQTPRALAAGFRHDGDVGRLVDAVMANRAVLPR